MNELLKDLIRQLNDIRRQVEALQRLEGAESADSLLGTPNTWTDNNDFESVATSGSALSVTRNLANTSTDSPVVSIVQDHASDDQDALRVQQDGTGNVIELLDGATVVLRVADGGRLDVYNIIRALTASGLRLEDDGGNLGVFVEDAGYVAIGHNAPDTGLHLIGAGADGTSGQVRARNTNANGAGVLNARNDADDFFQFVAWGSTFAGSTLGTTRAGKGMIQWSGATALVIGTSAAGELGLATNDTRRLTIDTSGKVGIGTTAPTSMLDVVQATVGNEVFRLQSTATNDDPTEQFFHGRVATTNGTVTTILTIPISASNTYLITAEIIARRTGGSAGSADDGYGARVSSLYKTVSGTVTLIGSVEALTEVGPNSATTLAISGTDVLVRVQGIANLNQTWHAFVKVKKVGS